MRSAIFVVLLLIPVFALAQTCGESDGLDIAAIPLVRGAENSISEKTSVCASQLVKARSVFLEFGDAEFGDAEFGDAEFGDAGRLGKLFLSSSVGLVMAPQRHCNIDTLQEKPEPSTNVHLRNHFDNSWAAFAGKKKGTVAFIGGSITE